MEVREMDKWKEREREGGECERNRHKEKKCKTVKQQIKKNQQKKKNS